MFADGLYNDGEARGIEWEYGMWVVVHGEGRDEFNTGRNKVKRNEGDDHEKAVANPIESGGLTQVWTRL